jgi:hypothetical protein
VKSQPNLGVEGGRIVHTQQAKVVFKADLWQKEKDEINGTKEYWVCRRHRVYTDI